MNHHSKYQPDKSKMFTCTLLSPWSSSFRQMGSVTHFSQRADLFLQRLQLNIYYKMSINFKYEKNV